MFLANWRFPLFIQVDPQVSILLYGSLEIDNRLGNVCARSATLCGGYATLRHAMPMHSHFPIGSHHIRDDILVSTLLFFCFSPWMPFSPSGIDAGGIRPAGLRSIRRVGPLRKHGEDQDGKFTRFIKMTCSRSFSVSHRCQVGQELGISKSTPCPPCCSAGA